MTADITTTKGYVSLDVANQWFDERGITHWDDAETADRKGALLRSADWLDRHFRFRGRPVRPDQNRAWPRTGFIDRSNPASDAIDQIIEAPPAVIEASLELALALLESDVAGEQLLGLTAPISRERIGNLSVSYASQQTMRPTRLHRMLMPYIEPVSQNHVVRT